MYTSTTAPTTGEAFIAVKKGRIKHYPTNLAGVQNSVYLSDKQAFEIELFNPSTTTKLAKISINGKPISASGIVLKPGQRHFIERYIDTPRKFQFDTYVVENSSAAMTAIQKNGLIEISFYDEKTPPLTPTIDWNSWPYNTHTYGGQNINYLNQTNNLLSRRGTSGDKVDFMGNVSSFCSTSGIAGQSRNSMSTTFDSLSGEQLRSASIKETGTVEQGGHSGQKFLNYSGSFNSWITNTVTLKILPASEKPVEMGEIAIHCTECGMRRKNNWKHCPTCGTKF